MLVLRRTVRPVVLALLGALVAAPTPAVETRSWGLTDPATLREGRASGIAVDDDGRLWLAPVLKPLEAASGLSSRQVWSISGVDNGDLYLGTGNEAGLLLYPRRGVERSLHSSDELAVQAVAAAPDGSVYFATTPDGTVYRVGNDGSPRVHFEPDEPYVWALSVDGSGRLWVATGDRGRLYRVDGPNQGRLVFDSDEPHLVCLAPDPRGGVLAGSYGRGLVYSVGPDGGATVVYQSEYDETTAVARADDGSVYAAFAQVPGRLGSPGLGPSEIPLNVELPDAAPTDDGTELLRGLARMLGRQQPAPTARGEIVRIASNGTARRVWTGHEQTPFSMATDASGRLYFGTQHPARLYELVDDRVRQLAELDALHVTSLWSSGDRLFVGTSDPGGVYRMDRAGTLSGEYVAPPLDCRTACRWGRLGWEASAPDGATVELSTRSGNSLPPDATWSSWSAPMRSVRSAVTSPTGRYLQWRARLASLRPTAIPWLAQVQVSYQQVNAAPEIAGVRTLPPGQMSISPSTDGRSRDTPSGRLRKIVWESSDPNNDLLNARVEISREGDSQWYELVDEWVGQEFTWDSALLPDGRYRARVEVTDLPSNTRATALTARADSEVFHVDHTAPRIEVADASARQVRFSVSETPGPLVTVRVSIDAGRWERLLPDDGVLDTDREEFTFRPEALGSGRHFMTIEAIDASGNRAVASVPSL